MGREPTVAQGWKAFIRRLQSGDERRPPLPSKREPRSPPSSSAQQANAALDRRSLVDGSCCVHRCRCPRCRCQPRLGPRGQGHLGRATDGHFRVRVLGARNGRQSCGLGHFPPLVWSRTYRANRRLTAAPGRPHWVASGQSLHAGRRTPWRPARFGGAGVFLPRGPGRHDVVLTIRRSSAYSAPPTL